MKKLLIILFLSPCFLQAQTRKHVLGMTFTTSPPIYSCEFCHSEVSPNSLLPIQYDTMHIPIDLGLGRKLWMNGYYELLRDFKKKNINSDSFFIARWNEKDTSCISSEIALYKSKNIGDNWIKTHKKGKYYLNKDDWMSTDGFVGSNAPTWYAMGGRFSDSILLADKWYKVIYEEKKK